MSSPVLIVGGGLAGLFTALKLAPNPVTVLAAAELGAGASSAWAQGGIAAAIAEGDTAEKHTHDTMIAGAGLVDEAMALGMAREAGDRVRDLLGFGVPFDKDLEGRLVQSREAAHSERRIVRVRGDMAGAAIMQSLIAAVRKTPSITVHERMHAEDIVMQNGRVAGVIARGDDGKRVRYHAKEIVLATGGVGHLYALTTNPVEASGIGIAMAARAGAKIADAEFVQFHPTAIDIGRDPAPLATEALRGEGAHLVNRAGERFMLKHHKDAELAPRDIVARAVFTQIGAGHGAYLDCRTAIGKRFVEDFPTVYASCKAAGIDPVTMPIPVAPAEHYHMGGVWTDAQGRTSVEGLWAVGEVASTGVHGANRLASNSLLEAVVFGARIAQALNASGSVTCENEDNGSEDQNDAATEKLLRQIMTDHVGVVRDGTGLRRAISELQKIHVGKQSARLSSMALSALFIACGALQREESRGGHFRTDRPNADPKFATRRAVTLAELQRQIHSIGRAL